MNNIQKKEKNLILLLDKLTGNNLQVIHRLTLIEKIEVEKNQLYLENKRS